MLVNKLCAVQGLLAFELQLSTSYSRTATVWSSKTNACSDITHLMSPCLAWQSLPPAPPGQELMPTSTLLHCKHDHRRAPKFKHLLVQALLVNPCQQARQESPEEGGQKGRVLWAQRAASPAQQEGTAGPVPRGCARVRPLSSDATFKLLDVACRKASTSGGGGRACSWPV